MDETEQIAQKLLNKEGHYAKKNPHPLSPDFECYAKHNCLRFFEIKSIGRNNDKIGFKMGQLLTMRFKDVVVFVVDRRTKKEVLRFKISEVKPNERAQLGV